MEDKKIKVTIVEQRGEGGMIHYAYQLCTAMSKVGAEVTLITTPSYELDDLPHNFRVEKIMKLWPQIDPLLYTQPKNFVEALWRKLFWGVRRGFRAIRLVTEWARVSYHLIRTSPDIVQFGELENTVEIPFIIIMGKMGLKLSQICHEFEKRETTKSLVKTINNKISLYIYRTFSAIFVHGGENRRLFLSLFNVPENHVHSIHHGNEQIFSTPPNTKQIQEQLRQQYGIINNEQVVVFFGNLTPSKGIPDLIRSFEYVKAKLGTAKLVIAGMPSKLVNMNEFKDLVKELQLEDVIFFDSRYIPMDEIEPLMQIANVVVFPYRNISQSGALQVAYAFGKPVIATNTGGFPDSVDDGKSGYLVPTESPVQLAEAIIKIISNPVLAKEMGSYSKHLSETRFAWEPIAEEILKVYKGI
jgi:glycosyltransferase involved in cell wall biosynthesis